MKHKDVVEAVSKLIEKRVISDHENRRSWNKTTGQWLVYGFETKLGFGGAVQLEAVVENAYKNKTSIFEAAKACLSQMYTNRGINLDDEVSK